MDPSIKYREATTQDIEQIMAVRHSVIENTLTDPTSISPVDVQEYITTRGKGWVAEQKTTIVGFSILDTRENSIWALFVRPGHEGLGIGRRLQEIMLRAHFAGSKVSLTLTTTKGTRAERFYMRSGWQVIGHLDEDELRFELSYEGWLRHFTARDC